MKKHWILILLACLFAGFSSGCSTEAGAGVVAGVAAMKKLSDDSQDRLIEAVNALNKETALINATATEIGNVVFIKPETISAIESLKGREKDPVAWIALASVLGNVFLGGRAIEKKKKKGT